MSFEKAAGWSKWLEGNHTDQTGIWMRIAKKDSGMASITYAEAVEEALCYGWIDGQRRAYDQKTFLQKFTPRRKRSIWSRVNIGKVEALMAEGRMKAPGLKEFEDARADGRLETAY